MTFFSPITKLNKLSFSTSKWPFSRWRISLLLVGNRHYQVAASWRISPKKNRPFPTRLAWRIVPSLRINYGGDHRIMAQSLVEHARAMPDIRWGGETFWLIFVLILSTEHTESGRHSIPIYFPTNFDTLVSGGNMFRRENESRARQVSNSC